MALESSNSVVDANKAVEFAREVTLGLASNPKYIPSRHLYDVLGSTLFQAICELPWYPITRAERALLATHAADIMRGLGNEPTLIELGAGSGDKLSLLLDLSEVEITSTTVHIIDSSSTALRLSGETLAKHEGLTVVLHETTYERGVREVVTQTHGEGPVMVLFLGSNIGNMTSLEVQSFLRLICMGFRNKDRLLLGTDLVKPERNLLLAYDDPLGVTAAFNKNLLVRLNRELDGDFDVEQFDHTVVWNAEKTRVESYLVSRTDQLVCLRGAGCCTSLEKGEAIWTESSHKYELDQLSTMATSAGFSACQQWIDADNGYALTMFEASASEML